jgi:hypothetical protein
MIQNHLHDLRQRQAPVSSNVRPSRPWASFGLRGGGFSAFSSRMASDPFRVALGGLPHPLYKYASTPEALNFMASQLKPTSC